MHGQRLTETHVLGYRIDRIETAKASVTHYEVLIAEGGAVLAQFADRSAAEKFIVMRELRSIELRPRMPAY